MTPEDRLSELEKSVRSFNMVSSGTNQVQGGFPEFKQKQSIEDRISHLENLHENFTIRGGSNVTVEGSFNHGFAICSSCPQDQGTGEGSIIIITPPSTPTGACCVGAGADCSIQTQQDCEDMGGTYQGDNTDCETSLCPCSCGFEAFDGSGRRFIHQDATFDNECDSGCEDCCNQPFACPPATICDEELHCTGYAEYDVDCNFGGFIDTSPDGHTLYICPDTHPDTCITQTESCTPWGGCGGDCETTATTLVCTSGGSTCTRTLSHECIPI